MVNLIGDEIAARRHWLDVPGACVHLYGKQTVRPGRKMGHVTRIFPEDGLRGASSIMGRARQV